VSIKAAITSNLLQHAATLLGSQVDLVLDDDLDQHLDVDGDVDVDPIVDLAP
jgi:hypothetical protein